MQERKSYRFQLKDFVPLSKRYERRNPIYDIQEFKIRHFVHPIILRKTGLMVYNTSILTAITSGLVKLLSQ